MPENYAMTSELPDSAVLGWRAASRELAIEIVTPFEVGAPQGGFEILAMVKNFGSERGTLVDWRGSGHESETRQFAMDGGFYFSTVELATYGSYDRELFTSTLDDWGWKNSAEPPAWYSGAAWGEASESI